MTCTGIRRLFDAYWDDETTKAERELIEAHFAACPTCRAEYEAYARTLEAVASLPRLEASSDLLERVTAGARRAVPAPDRLPVPARPTWVPAAAAATVALLGLLTLVPWLVVQRGLPRGGAARTAALVRQPELVQVGTARTSTPHGATALRGAHGGAVTDSLFDHTEDVEFMVDPVAVRRGAGAARSANDVQADRAVITF